MSEWKKFMKLGQVDIFKLHKNGYWCISDDTIEFCKYNPHIHTNYLPNIRIGDWYCEAEYEENGDVIEYSPITEEIKKQMESNRMKQINLFCPALNCINYDRNTDCKKDEIALSISDDNKNMVCIYYEVKEKQNETN